MHIHEEFALDVFTRESAKVDFIKYDAGWLVDAEEANEEGEQRDAANHLPVGGGEMEDVVVADANGGVVVGGVWWFVGRRLDHRRFARSAIGALL